MSDSLPIMGQPGDREALKQRVLGTRPMVDPASGGSQVRRP